MQVIKDYIRDGIYEAAKTLFFKKNYANVSMREIAMRAHVGVSNIYNYYKNKDELFVQVVQPAVDMFEHMIDVDKVSGCAIAEMSSEMFCHDMVEKYMDILKQNRKELYILIFHAQGSSLETFKEDFSERVCVLVRDFLTKYRCGASTGISEVSDFTIRYHVLCLFTFFEEMLKKKQLLKEQKIALEEYVRFETLGWGELMRR